MNSPMAMVRFSREIKDEVKTHTDKEVVVIEESVDM